MASGTTRISDLVVPSIFAEYVEANTKELSALVQSGALVVSERLNAHLRGGGITFNEPFFKDLDNDADNVSSDDPSTLSSPNKIGTGTEIQVRLSRNNSWSTMDLAEDISGADPMARIISRVSAYWTRRLQAVFVASMKGVFADNTANDSGDMTHDISGASFSDGVTNFSAEAFIDACATMGDAQDDLTMVMCHSIVYNRMRKNNLIDFIPDSQNPAAVGVPTFLGKRIIVDDGVPYSSNVYDTWIFKAGALRLGMGAPPNPVEVDRTPAAGNGSGSETLYSRVQWALHPVGFAYVGTAPNGGPSNANTSNNLAAATSWNRVFPERKQIGIARLITREA